MELKFALAHSEQPNELQHHNRRAPQILCSITCKLLFANLFVYGIQSFLKWESTAQTSIGLDFGYSNDPTAIVEIYKYNDKRIINEVCYRTGMVNSDIARMLPKNTFVYADSAEPKSIEEIRRFGINIMPVKKGADSIMFGITTMQTQNYLVTKSSKNIINEFEKYIWDKDKNNNAKNKPVDKFNHAMDALRYHEMMDIGVNEKVFFF